LSSERIKQVDGLRFGDPVHAIATRNEAKSVEVIIYHLNDADQENEAVDSLTVNLEIANLPFEHFEARWYAIDESHSNSYALWEAMGRPKTLSASQARELSARDDLELVKPAWLEHSRERWFRMKLRLQSNSVALFVLSAMDRGRENATMQEAF
jgi:xylan 1,4-beta-xylosidase